MKAKLVVVGGDTKTTEVNLRLPTTIGRGREVELTLPHPLVSRKHCQIFERDGRLFVRDLGSLNGTFLNNQRLDGEGALDPDQLLTLGNVTFRAVYEPSESNESVFVPNADTENGVGGRTLPVAHQPVEIKSALSALPADPPAEGIVDEVISPAVAPVAAELALDTNSKEIKQAIVFEPEDAGLAERPGLSELAGTTDHDESATDTDKELADAIEAALAENETSETETSSDKPIQMAQPINMVPLAKAVELRPGETARPADPAAPVEFVEEAQGESNSDDLFKNLPR